MTALLTILLNITYGLLSGILLSLLTVLFRSQTPNKYQLGRVADTHHYRPVGSYEKVKRSLPHILFDFVMALRMNVVFQCATVCHLSLQHVSLFRQL